MPLSGLPLALGSNHQPAECIRPAWLEVQAKGAQSRDPRGRLTIAPLSRIQQEAGTLGSEQGRPVAGEQPFSELPHARHISRLGAARQRIDCLVVAARGVVLCSECELRGLGCLRHLSSLRANQASAQRMWHSATRPACSPERLDLA